MNALINLHDDAVDLLEHRVAPWLLPTLARIVFAAVFFVYFWNSATLKLDGLFTPTAGAFGQIFPKSAEAVLWDVSQATIFQKTVMVLGGWAEFVLPILLLVGFATRLAALGMIGFVLVQSLVDVTGHGVALGAWFDNDALSAIMDQRTLWVFLLAYMVFRGAGPISVDAAIRRLRGEALTPQSAD
ncbi:MAG: DoxX family protein [Rhodobacter sp.]|nr:DoxX family protein [Rhodobacter sp.]